MNPAGSFLPGMRNLAITPAMKPMTIVQIIPMAMVLQKRTPLIHDDTHYVLREERSGQPVHSDQGIWPYLVEGSGASPVEEHCGYAGNHRSETAVNAPTRDASADLAKPRQRARAKAAGGYRGPHSLWTAAPATLLLKGPVAGSLPQELDGTSRCAHLSLGRAPAKLTGGCGAVTSITFRCLTWLR